MYKTRPLLATLFLFSQGFGINPEIFSLEERGFKKFNRVSASFCQTAGYFGLRRWAFPKATFSPQDVLLSGAASLMSEVGGTKGMVIGCTFRGLSLTQSLSQCIAAYDFGMTALATTVGISALSFAAPWVTQRLSLG